MSGPAPSNERRASTSNLSGRAPSIFYTKMVDDEVRKRGSSRCVSSQPAAEQLLISHSPKSPPALSPYPRWHSLRTPLCIAIAATPLLPRRTRFASGLPLPMLLRTMRRKCHYPTIWLLASRLLLPQPYDKCATTCYSPAVRLCSLQPAIFPRFSPLASRLLYVMGIRICHS